MNKNKKVRIPSDWEMLQYLKWTNDQISYAINHPIWDMPVYRYFDEVKYAMDFATGKNIRLSTLGICRGYENPQKGDKLEGVQKYYLSEKNITGDYNSPLPGVSGHQSNVTIKDLTIVEKHSDSYVLCTTRSFSPGDMQDFGKFCIRVSSPVALCYFITKSMKEKYNIDLVDAIFCPVTYRNREFKDDEVSPGHLAFVKDIEYQPQDEYRFLWIPKDMNENITYFDLECREISSLCRMVYKTKNPLKRFGII